MGLRINHNTTAINAHRNLQSNDVGMSKTLEKLSSGLKVNRAADGPAALMISENMRAQIAGLNQAIDNSESAISMVQTTEANLNEVSSLLTSVRQLAIHAANEGVNDEKMLEADQKEITNALDTIDRISRQAQFGSKRLLDGSNGATGTTTGDDIEFISAGLNSKASGPEGFDVKITQEATKASIEGTAVLTESIVDAGETMTITQNGKQASYTTNADDNVDTAIKNLESEIKRNGMDLDVTKTDDGRIQVQHKEFGTGKTFQVSSTTAGVLSTQAGQIESAQAGQDVKGTINGESAVGEGQILTAARGADTEGVAVKYTGTLVGQEADEPSGVEGEVPQYTVGKVHVSQNSLNFQVGANKNQTTGISVGSTNTRELAKGVTNDSGYSSLRDLDVTTFQGAQDAIAMVDSAIEQIASSRGDLGAFQKNTLESNLNNLRVANENLVSSESVIRDADMAAEMSNFTKNQIMTQSATAMLAQANQAPRSVLQLLG